MPVVGRGDQHGVESVEGEQLAKVVVHAATAVAPLPRLLGVVLLDALAGCARGARPRRRRRPRSARRHSPGTAPRARGPSCPTPMMPSVSRSLAAARAFGSAERIVGPTMPAAAAVCTNRRREIERGSIGAILVAGAGGWRQAGTARIVAPAAACNAEGGARGPRHDFGGHFGNAGHRGGPAFVPIRANVSRPARCPLPRPTGSKCPVRARWQWPFRRMRHRLN